jgi:hypothetical protein
MDFGSGLFYAHNLGFTTRLLNDEVRNPTSNLTAWCRQIGTKQTSEPV